MMIYDQKPPLDEALLAHHGVKGMHWGIRKKDESSGSRPKKSPEETANENRNTKEYMAAADKARRKKVTPAQAKKNLADNHTKFLSKFEASEDDSKKGLSPEQKAALKKAAVGVAVVGTLAALAYYGNKQGVFDKFKPDGGVLYNPDTIKGMSGKPVSVAQYRHNVSMSTASTWRQGAGAGYITKESFARPEVTLSAGHTFHRISKSAESSFSKFTYSTTSTEDFNRYATSFAGIPHNYTEALHHVTWSTTKDFKVPSLHTVLETAHEVLKSESDLPDSMKTREYALKWYTALNGSSWNTQRADTLFSALKEKGYSAIVDEMDHGVQGDLPLVIFNTEGLTSKVSKVMSNKDLKNAQSSVTELLVRKLSSEVFE
jgi:hypothetical protein